ILFEKAAEEDKKEPESEPQFPEIKKGNPERILKLAEELEIENIKGQSVASLAKVKKTENQIILEENEISAGKVPDVTGMGASDAVFLLENAGLQVQVKGVGKVQKQSLKPGTSVRRGAYVYLTLG
ncbi:MAG TPA: PASTA domain-containing protein, partial [Tangfeifania sp.]|nr:PASTA domain-containing protein [Tangfeifania sp.]